MHVKETMVRGIVDRLMTRSRWRSICRGFDKVIDIASRRVAFALYMMIDDRIISVESVPERLNGIIKTCLESDASTRNPPRLIKSQK